MTNIFSSHLLIASLPEKLMTTKAMRGQFLLSPFFLKIQRTHFMDKGMMSLENSFVIALWIVPSQKAKRQRSSIEGMVPEMWYHQHVSLGAFLWK